MDRQQGQAEEATKRGRGRPKKEEAKKKQPAATSLRLDKRADYLWEVLARSARKTKTATMEALIMEEAQRQGYSYPPGPGQPALALFGPELDQAA